MLPAEHRHPQVRSLLDRIERFLVVGTAAGAAACRRSAPCDVVAGDRVRAALDRSHRALEPPLPCERADHHDDPGPRGLRPVGRMAPRGRNPRPSSRWRSSPSAASSEPRRMSRSLDLSAVPVSLTVWVGLRGLAGAVLAVPPTSISSSCRASSRRRGPWRSPRRARACESRAGSERPPRLRTSARCRTLSESAGKAGVGRSRTISLDRDHAAPTPPSGPARRRPVPRRPRMSPMPPPPIPRHRSLLAGAALPAAGALLALSAALAA